MSVYISAFYASLLAIFYVYLSALVINERRKAGVGIGSGNHPALERMIRVHANFIEYVPLSLFLLLCLENLASAGWIVHLSGVLLFLSRLAHAAGLRHNAGVSWQRFVGTLGTFLTLLWMAACNLYFVHSITL